MAVNFPVPTSVGETFTEPTNGNVYTCTQVGPPAVWFGTIQVGNLDTIYLRLNAANDPMTGNLDTLGVTATGQVAGTQQTINTNTWDLRLGNFWTAGGVALPQPTFGVTGQSGLLTITSAITTWPAPGGTLKYPGGLAPAPIAYPAIIPFYVQSPTSVLLGELTQNIV